MIKIIGRSDPINKDAINTTSRSNNWSRGLSPFFLGPVLMYDGTQAKNVENAWQFSKVYGVHIDKEGNILPSYFEWAKKGWSDKRAHRYPMPKGVKPLFSLWGNDRLNYVTARKRIYIPLYASAVVNTSAFIELKKQYQTFGEVVLWDFDGYDHTAMGMSLKDVANNPNRPMGHAFVLSMLLNDCLDECMAL
jgi:hypothetical protein